MEIKDILAGIIAKKEELGMTAQQLADKSNVPKSTVDRILRGDTANPLFQTILDLAAAVDYELFDSPKPKPVKIPIENDASPYLQHIIAMYERQLADKDASHARELAKHERQHNLMTAEKNRWIKILAIIVGILGVGVVTILLIDILNPTVGWIQREVAYNSAKETNAVLMAIENFCSIK